MTRGSQGNGLPDRPTVRPEKPSNPPSALGSANGREEGTVGSHLWGVVDDTYLRVDQCEETDGAGSTEPGKLGATNRKTQFCVPHIEIRSTYRGH